MPRRGKHQTGDLRDRRERSLVDCDLHHTWSMSGPYPAARWIPVILLGSLAACTGTIIGGDDPGGSPSGGAGAGHDDAHGDDGRAVADDPDAPTLDSRTPLRG